MRKVLAPCFAVLIGLVPVTGTAAPDSDLKSATELLRLSLEEWTREDAAYRTARTAGKVSAAEAAEHAGFVAGLRVRVLEQCETVRRLGGEEALQGYDCVRMSPQGGQVLVMVPPSAVLTEEEKKAAIAARLDELEGEVDSNLQQRQQEIRQKAAAGSARVASRNSGGAAGGGAAGAGSSGSGGSSAAPGSTWGPPAERSGQGDQSETGAAGGRSASTGSAGGQQVKPGSPGSRAGATRHTATDGGIDDDVVARQLREAAEKETDPVLKEKLWAEYRKYKESRK